MATIARLGEFPFIDAIAAVARQGRGRGVRVGIGDDAAVVDGFGRSLLTTDVQVENVHFESAWIGPRDLGVRAFRVAVSDVAAMGGRARYVLLSLIVPGSYDAGAARSLVRGLVGDVEAAGASLVGGNVSAGPVLGLGVTVVGEARDAVLLRSGASAGDAIFVTGTVGSAAAGIELLGRGSRRGALVAAYRRPPRRLDVGAALARSGLVTSMVDVSDGLVQDLDHVCEASAVAARLDVDRIPISTALARAAGGARRRSSTPPGRAKRLRLAAIEYALHGGDDYELLFTARGRDAERRLRASCDRAGCMLSRIGEIVRDDVGDRVTDRNGRRLTPRGYAHFRTSK